MSKTNANSVSVLDDADESLRRLDWILFCQEQEQLLYGGSEHEWAPGRPLHSYPQKAVGMSSDVVTGEQYAESYYVGNYPRPMVQILDNPDPKGMCEECEVSWDYRRRFDPCWVCGVVRYPKENGDVPDHRPSPTHQGAVLFDVEIIERNAQAYHEEMYVDINGNERAMPIRHNDTSDQQSIYVLAMQDYAQLDVDWTRMLMRLENDAYLDSIAWNGPTTVTESEDDEELWRSANPNGRTIISTPRQFGGHSIRHVVFDEWASMEPIESGNVLSSVAVDGVVHRIQIPAELPESDIPLPIGPFVGRSLEEIVIAMERHRAFSRSITEVRRTNRG